MRKSDSKGGFSLTEVLLAVGTLAIGMLLVAGVFPVSIRFTTIATERTIAAIVADEAFAKIKLYAEGNPNDPNDNIDPAIIAPYNLTDFNDVYTDWWVNYAGVSGPPLPPALLPHHEFSYPSDGTVNIFGKQYFWSALCRRVVPADQFYIDPNMLYGINSSSRLVQITVFVCRKIGSNQKYPLDNLDVPFYEWPRPVKVGVKYPDPQPPIRTDILQIFARPLAYASGDVRVINDGSTIVDDYSGRIYRVLERDPAAPAEITLDRSWVEMDWHNPSFPLHPPAAVWVIPPPVGGGRYPCIAVYQKIIRF